ncbi:MAG: hypothetical protein J7M01_02740 [Candidatus Marinimicrobia bacterium]|nr:hypothetical protein [Candidatus Neomarinimicrobiota bacterium]
MTNERTITVNNFFGDKQMNKNDFINVWSEHISQLKLLDYNEIWQDKVDDMMMGVRNKASNEFNRLYKFQNTDITGEF